MHEYVAVRQNQLYGKKEVTELVQVDKRTAHMFSSYYSSVSGDV